MLSLPALDNLLDGRPLHVGEYGLWLRVTTLAVLHLLDGRFSGQAERDFLFDENNDFFNAVCEQLYPRGIQGTDPGSGKEIREGPAWLLAGTFWDGSLKKNPSPAYALPGAWRYLTPRRRLTRPGGGKCHGAKTNISAKAE